MSAAKDTKDNKESKPVMKGVNINVLGRDLRVAAPEGEERAMLASVDLLNRKIKEIRDTGKVVGNERIAILAALNIAHEHLQGAPIAPSERKAPASTADDAVVRARLAQFEAMLDRAMNEQEKLF